MLQENNYNLLKRRGKSMIICSSLEVIRKLTREKNQNKLFQDSLMQKFLHLEKCGSEKGELKNSYLKRCHIQKSDIFKGGLT